MTIQRALKGTQLYHFCQYHMMSLCQDSFAIDRVQHVTIATRESLTTTVDKGVLLKHLC